MRHPILILGGTLEARQLAGRLAVRDDISVTLSLAGRTERPAEQGVPIRSGGFGGPEGLAAYLAQNDIRLLIDATHPYAARISANAADAARLAGTPLIALRRPAWEPVTGDRWTLVADSGEAVRMLGPAPRIVFLALGRQELLPFETAPQHRYIVRSVDPVKPRLNLHDVDYILARGPFDEAAEEALLRKHEVDAIVAKNSGGAATYGKISAARRLGIEVILFRRPNLPQVDSGASVDEVHTKAVHALCLA